MFPVRCSMCPTRPAMAWERGMPSHLIRARTHRIDAVACDGRHNMTLLPRSSWMRHYRVAAWPLPWSLASGTGRRPTSRGSRQLPSVVYQRRTGRPLHPEPVFPRICRDAGLGTTGATGTTRVASLQLTIGMPKAQPPRCGWTAPAITTTQGLLVSTCHGSPSGTPVANHGLRS